MFKRGLEQQQQHTNQLRTSDKRRLLERCVTAFGPAAEALFRPRDDAVSAVSARTYDGQRAKIYLCRRGGDASAASAEEPILFEAASVFAPSLYALWRAPRLLGSVATHAAVLGPLVNGANLMLAGVTHGLDPADGAWRTGDLRAVVAGGAAVAVGVVACSREEAAARKGVGVRVLHVYKDFLWAMGPRTLLPDLKEEEEPREPTAAAAPSSDVVAPTEEAAASAAASAEVEQTNHPPPKLPTMDEQVEVWLLQSLKAKVRKEALPLLVSTFYAVHMLPLRPAEGVDLKASSYKKIGKLLEWARAKGVLAFETDAAGTSRITEVNREHTLFRGLPAVASKDEDEDDEAKQETPLITELFGIPPKARAVFGVGERDDGLAVTRKAAVAALMQYIKAKGLDADVRARNVTRVDDVLGRLLGAREISGVVEKKQLAELFVEKLNAFYVINRDDIPEAARVHKGKPKPVRLSIERRGGSRFVTRVDNLVAFCINPEEVAHELSTLVAASASTQLGGAKGDEISVIVLGEHVQAISSLLQSKYRLPSRLIEASTEKKKAPKKK